MEKQHTEEYYKIMHKAPNVLTRYGFVILLLLLAVLLYCTVRYWNYLFEM